MRAGDILSSPHFWILTGICVAGGWYAKRSLIDGIIVGGIAPLILAPLWFVVTFALGIPYAILMKLSPGLIDSAIALYASWPEEVAFLLSPPTLITAILFIVYCRSERPCSDLPSCYRPKRRQTSDHNPFSHSFR